MPYKEHTPVKPEKLVATAAVAIEAEVVLPNLFQKESFENYKGAKGDTVNVRVEGVLPWREYGWRNDRSKPIEFDTYKERQFGVTLGRDIYSAVALTDEQYNLDFDGWSKLVVKQGEAVGRGANAEAVSFLTDDKNYDVQFGLAENNLRAGFIKLRQVMGRLHTPGNRKVIVGTDVEAALLESDLLVNYNASPQTGENALRDATIGRIYGMDVVVSQELKPDEFIAMGDSAFVMANAAPAVPQSVKFGAVGSYKGISTRLIQQYNHMYLQDESVLNTWLGFRTVRDVLLGLDDSNQAFVSETEHQVRAVKGKLNGTGKFTSTAAAELKKVTGLKDSDLTVAAKAAPATKPGL